MQPKILLAVADEHRRLSYEEFLRKQHVICQTVMSLRDVAAQTAKQPYHAIFLDMSLMVRASQNEKSMVEDSLRALPYARLNLTPAGEVSILVTGDGHENSSTPEEYLQFCCKQPVRIVQPRKRIQLHINALLSLADDMSKAERTACLDISPGGCFLFSTNEEMVQQAAVLVRLMILHDPTPIAATICWKREWGMTNDMPGVGVRFDSMSDQQHEQLIALCRERQEK